MCSDEGECTGGCNLLNSCTLGRVNYGINMDRHCDSSCDSCNVDMCLEKLPGATSCDGPLQLHGPPACNFETNYTDYNNIYRVQCKHYDPVYTSGVVTVADRGSCDTVSIVCFGFHCDAKL